MEKVEKVYVVDDDKFVASALHRVFRSAGFEVEVFHCARDFLAHFTDGGNACLILDLRMPEVGGLEVLQLLRQRQSDIPVIVHTGNADVAVAVKAMRGGAFSVIEKPYSSELMIAEVRAAMAAAAQPRALNRRLREARSSVAALSERERTLVPLLAEGQSARQAAAALGLSARTVEAHRANIFKKLGINSTAALVRIALLAELAEQYRLLAN